MGVACFLRYCLLAATDQLILMVLRRINDLWREVVAGVPGTVNWADLYQMLVRDEAVQNLLQELDDEFGKS